MNPDFVHRIETMVWVVAKCGFRTWPCFALLQTMTLRRNDTFWVAISNSICVLLMMTTLAAFWDISIYGLSLMPYIEIMLNVVWAFGKVKLEYDPFFLLVLSMEWILILCTELRPWYELSQNAVSGHGHVLRYCQLWLCGGMTHFELLFLTQPVSYWWWHSLRHRNSCLHENATLKNDLNFFSQNVSFLT